MQGDVGFGAEKTDHSGASGVQFGTRMLSRGECLAALSRIDDNMEAALEQARRRHAGDCLAALREILAPFDLSGHEVRITSDMDSTHVCVHIREGAQRARQPESLRTDGVLLDVLQEIDVFLQAHDQWVQHLDGAVLNP